MKTRMITKVLLCALPVTCIQNGYASSKEAEQKDENDNNDTTFGKIINQTTTVSKIMNNDTNENLQIDEQILRDCKLRVQEIILTNEMLTELEKNNNKDVRQTYASSNLFCDKMVSDVAMEMAMGAMGINEYEHLTTQEGDSHDGTGANLIPLRTAHDWDGNEIDNGNFSLLNNYQMESLIKLILKNYIAQLTEARTYSESNDINEIIKEISGLIFEKWQKAATSVEKDTSLIANQAEEFSKVLFEGAEHAVQVAMLLGLDRFGESGLQKIRDMAEALEFSQENSEDGLRKCSVELKNGISIEFETEGADIQNIKVVQKNNTFTEEQSFNCNKEEPIQMTRTFCAAEQKTDNYWEIDKDALSNKMSELSSGKITDPSLAIPLQNYIQLIYDSPALRNAVFRTSLEKDAFSMLLNNLYDSFDRSLKVKDENFPALYANTVANMFINYFEPEKLTFEEFIGTALSHSPVTAAFSFINNGPIYVFSGQVDKEQSLGTAIDEDTKNKDFVVGETVFVNTPSNSQENQSGAILLPNQMVLNDKLFVLRSFLGEDGKLSSFSLDDITEKSKSESELDDSLGNIALYESIESLGLSIEGQEEKEVEAQLS